MFLCKPNKGQDSKDKQIIGHMKIIVKGGQFQDCAKLSKMSPQVEITVNKVKKQTKVNKSAGKYPIWQDQNELVFELNQKVLGGNVHVIHKRSVFSNCDIGYGYIDFQRYMDGNLYQGQTIKLLKDFKSSGTLHFEIQYFHRNQMQPQNQPPSGPIIYNQTNKSQVIQQNNQNNQFQRLHQTFGCNVPQYQQDNQQQRSNQSVPLNNNNQQQYNNNSNYLQRQNQTMNNININDSPFYQADPSYYVNQSQSNGQQLTDEQIQQRISEKQQLILDKIQEENKNNQNEQKNINQNVNPQQC